MEPPPVDHLAAFLEQWRSPSDRDSPVGWLIDSGPSAGEWSLVDRLETQLRSSGALVAAGGWRRELCRPFGGLSELADRLAAAVYEHDPEIVRRYGLTLISLAPTWRSIGALRHTRVLSSGLADTALRGDTAGLTDFYWKRDSAPKIIADLISFFIDSASALSAAHGGRRIVLRLDGIERADAVCIGALRLLSQYARGTALMLMAEVPSHASAGLTDELAGSWRRLSVSDPVDQMAPTMPADAGPLLTALAACAQPCPLSALARLMADAWTPRSSAIVDTCLNDGILRADHRRLVDGEPSERCLTFAAVTLRDFLYDRLDADHRRSLHRRALDIERGDPFAASWHSMAAGTDDSTTLHAAALDAAWAVSHHESIMTLATRLLATTAKTASPDPDLLLALVHYDAGRGLEADKQLLNFLARHSTYTARRTLALQLLGYNAIFQLNDFDRGCRLLDEVLDARRRGGRESASGYLRNAMAYAMFRSGRIDEAEKLEQTALADLERAGEPAGFLSSILQLNLGRLQRTKGETDHALDLLNRALTDQSWDASPYMLLIFHSARALLELTRGNAGGALAAYHQILGLARDVKLECAAEPVTRALAQASGIDVTGKLTRSDEILFQLYLNVALCCRRLGLAAAADAWRTGLRSKWAFLSDDVWTAVDAAQARAADTSPQAPTTTASRFHENSASTTRAFAHLVRPAAREEATPEALAARLARDQILAIVSPESREDLPGLIESLVLYHPARPELAKRVNAEFGSAGIPQGRSILILDEDAQRFGALHTALPLFYQQVTVPRELRNALSAVNPIRLYAQVVDGRDEIFGALLRAWRDLTGLGVLAAAPFCLCGRDLAVTPHEAIVSFLASSSDYLLLADRPIEKIHGPSAPQNLSPLRPRLSKHASIQEPDFTKDDGLIVRVAIVSYKSEFLRLRRELKPLLTRCDGSRTVEEIIEDVRPLWPEEQEIEARTCTLLRDLWRRRVIRFDSPTSDWRVHAPA